MDIIIPHVIHVSIYVRISPYEFPMKLPQSWHMSLREAEQNIRDSLAALPPINGRANGRPKDRPGKIMAKRSGRLLVCKGSWFATLNPNNGNPY